MATQEFYIRNETETDARGPFTVEQLISLAEAGQVTPETLYYEATGEQWIAINDDAQLRSQIFPEKKRLFVKRDSKIPSINKSRESDAAVDVNEMLAAAEGRTSETRDKRSKIDMVERCAKAGTLGVLGTLILFVAAETLPGIEVLTDFSLPKLAANPFVLFGLIDLLLVIVIGLGVISFYPFIRFRAMAGMGFAGVFYYVQDQPVHMAAAAAGCAGLYFCTVFLSYIPMAVALALGLGGAGGLAFMLIF